MSIVKLNNNGVKNATAVGSITGLGNLKLIKTQTVSSGVSSVSFVDGASSVVLDNTYKEYIFFWSNFHPASDDQNLFFNMSVDTGSNYNVTKTTTYFRANHNENDGSASINYRTGEDLAQATGYQKLTLGTNNDNDSGSSGYLHLFEPSSSVFVKHFIARVSDAYGEPSNNDTFIAGYGNTTSAVDAIDFKFGSGNIDAGTISLYGVV